MWAEIQVFQGRMYVTASSTGVRVDDDISDPELGRVIVEQLRRPPGDWKHFCEDVAGVPVHRFDPEKQVRAWRDGGDWKVDAKPRDMDSPIRTVAASELGAAVRRELAAMEPRWPSLRCAMIMTTATDQLVVMPNIGGYSVGPARVTGPADLHGAVHAALASAEFERLQDAPAYKEALSAAGVDPHLLDGGASVRLDELSDGTVRLTGSSTGTGSGTSSGTERPTWLGRIEALGEACAAAAETIRALPTQHLPPGTPAGCSFGYKCSWLAVRGSGTAEVAAAVGLTGTRPVDWDEGVDAAYQGEVFVSPPTAGWVFVVSALFPFDGRAVAALSARLGTEVQFFGTHRVSEYHEWAYATGGRLVRRLCCVGSSGDFEQEGPPTPVEIELGISEMTWDDWNIDEEIVMRLAAAWSIDPTTLHLVESSARTGLASAQP